jgi:hypothetical protein
MTDVHRTYEIRCPIHGFIALNNWEWNVIQQRAFQRLRRIRQLAWTDYIYPGAVHTRFEHSLGVMQVATLLYRAIVNNSRAILTSELAYNDTGLERDLQLVRFAALLHDVGHGPFSHASEDLMPVEAGKRYAHADYSVAVIRSELRQAIEEHPLNDNYRFQAEDVAALIAGGARRSKHSVFWRDVIDGQMDADRMDYLLRDSYHAGVQYGKFDLHRLVSTIRAVSYGDRAPRLGIAQGGVHAAEALVLARYFMFTQVYFHKTRVAYDIHLKGALKELLPGGHFPRPVDGELQKFLAWDDWKVLGLLSEGKGGEHGARLKTRDHYRLVFPTPEVPDEKDLQQLELVKQKLGDLVVAEEAASKSWYKTGPTDIPVVDDLDETIVSPLSDHSNVVKNLESNNQVLLYVRHEDVAKAQDVVREVRGNG